MATTHEEYVQELIGLGVKGIVSKANAAINKAFESKSEKADKIPKLALDCCRDLAFLKGHVDSDILLDAILESIIN
ncbi:MAG: hypothetical protein J3T61_12015 [Candidatus Brocadiales bacterium]|nr:hypothetical protein [Candidatus Bathyanammoxibius sp.]